MEASGCFDDTLPTTNERDKKRHWVGQTWSYRRAGGEWEWVELLCFDNTDMELMRRRRHPRLLT